VPGLGTTFGRGGATNYQQDIQNSDCVWIQGSSMAEAHPVGFRWVMKAKERGAKVIHVDPHFSRTSAIADIHLQIRAGTDIAFVGGLIHHVIETESYFRDYVVNYTNAATIINDKYKGPEELQGLFAGFDPETGTYDRSKWMYEGGDMPSAAGQREHSTQAFSDRTGAGMHVGKVDSDPTLEHERCVFQVMKRHYARYTPEMVERICGVRKEDFLAVAETLVANSGRERTSMLVYALGWTQHSSGVQMIRSGAILQLLLGNVGRPGGGVMAMRGHASIQGSSDIPTLYELLPGYLPMPRAADEDLTLESYVASGGSDRGWWSFFEVYIVSLLKAYFGPNATKENDYGFGWLPKISGNHSHFATMLRALDGGLEGLFAMGQNPAVGSQNAGLQRRALANLKWLVVRDMADVESARFWKDSPEVQSGELRTEDIQTEVFLMPAAGHVEKEGHFTNTQRLLQYRDKALDPPGDARSELHFMHHLAKRVMAHYADSTEDKDWPLRNLHWDYPEHGEHAEPDAESVLKEIGGYETATGRPLSGFTELRSDGSTACGCWIYSGCFADGVNQPRRRDPGDIESEGGSVSPEWGWAWPANRRLLYNRASADPSGKPWSERKKYVWWDEEQGKWTGYDVPDFPVDKKPSYRAPDDAEGMDAISGDDPFIMMADGRGWLFSPSGLLDGPLPAHYEPLESPVDNALYPEVQSNPIALVWQRDGNRMAPPRDPRYPVVASTFRLTEHHTAGAMSRNLPWLAELQPEMFCEIAPGLAAERGIEDGEWMTVYTERGEIEARAKVTHRVRPMQIGDTTVHQISMPWHWGFFTTNAQGVTGDSANDLVPLTGDPNVSIEDKVFACNVRAGRRSHKPGPSFGTQRGSAQAARPDHDHAAEHPDHAGQRAPRPPEGDLGEGAE
jgi:formate dehydrogenase major subunit